MLRVFFSSPRRHACAHTFSNRKTTAAAVAKNSLSQPNGYSYEKKAHRIRAADTTHHVLANVLNDGDCVDTSSGGSRSVCERGAVSGNRFISACAARALNEE